MRDVFRDAFGFAAVVILVGAVLFGGLIAGVNRMAFPGRLAQIEQLRKDSSQVSVQESEDVIGQITQWNQGIASAKKYNNIWWADMFIPDGWNDIEPIKIPSR